MSSRTSHSLKWIPSSRGLLYTLTGIIMVIRPSFNLLVDKAYKVTFSGLWDSTRTRSILVTTILAPSMQYLLPNRLLSLDCSGYKCVVWLIMGTYNKILLKGDYVFCWRNLSCKHWESWLLWDSMYKLSRSPRQGIFGFHLGEKNIWDGWEATWFPIRYICLPIDPEWILICKPSS